ncbi:hypothetical protein [Streptomyces sp. FXJ1.172]|uniref:hypothetical protein n=1 Tax=Streptomyces sp. FXJ1.172 TaxID=710705 RepID=UPI003FA75B57
MTTEGRIEACRSLLVRLARFTGRTLRGEWHAIVVEPVQRLARRGLSGLLLAFVAAFGVIFFQGIAQHPLGRLWVTRLGGVKADLPLWLSLLRTPVSLYVPALDLPVWAGITQLFLAFAWAELALGRARTLAISYATTLAGTLTARVMIAMGPGWGWGFGLPPECAHVLDTGPSAAVVGLFTYLAVIKRAPVVFTLTGGSMVWESIAIPNLAGREHLIAVGSAIVLGLLHGRRERLRALVRRLLSGLVRPLPSQDRDPAPAPTAAPAPAPKPSVRGAATAQGASAPVPATTQKAPAAGIAHAAPAAGTAQTASAPTTVPVAPSPAAVQAAPAPGVAPAAPAPASAPAAPAPGTAPAPAAVQAAPAAPGSAPGAPAPRRRRPRSTGPAAAPTAPAAAPAAPPPGSAPAAPNPMTAPVAPAASPSASATSPAASAPAVSGAASDPAPAQPRAVPAQVRADRCGTRR